MALVAVAGRLDRMPVVAPDTLRRATWMLAGLAGVFVAGPLAEAFRSAYYATGVTTRPVQLEAAVFTAGLGLKAAGFWWFGVAGLAVAASAQAVLGAVVLGASLSVLDRRRQDGRR
jgi:peptidoglycan biosynthesis protein MviN/MurJ (putative lipid II flippase)